MYAEIEAHKLLNIKELIFKMGAAGSAKRSESGHIRLSH